MRTRRAIEQLLRHAAAAMNAGGLDLLEDELALPCHEKLRAHRIPPRRGRRTLCDMRPRTHRRNAQRS